MFGFGKKKAAPPSKPPLSDDQKSALVQGLSEFLGMQLGIASYFTPAKPGQVTQIELEKGQINKKAIGYIYGFVDAALQNQGETIADVYVGPPILFGVMRRLFPGQEGRYMEFWQPMRPIRR